METFIYIIKSIAILSIFYIIYRIVLQKDTFFNANRHYLLSGIIAALIFPFIEYTKTIYKDIPAIQTTVIENTPFLAATETIIQPQVQPLEINWWQIGLIMYTIGVCIMMIRLCIQLISLHKLIASYPKMHKEGYSYVQITDKTITPFSFFKTICYNPNLHNAKELAMILAHEKIHVRQKHTIDVLLTQCILAIQWFNPLAWLYKKSLEQNLEFIADNGAIQEAPSSKEYQRTLVKVSSTLLQPALTNNFYHSLIKKRIVMLNKQTSRKRNLWKLGLVLPVLTLFMYSFNVKEVITYREINIDESAFAKAETNQAISVKGNTINIDINAETTDAQLIKIQQDIANQGIALEFSNTQKNENNTIAAITIDTHFSDIDTVSNWTVAEKNKGEGIENITLNYLLSSKDIEIQYGIISIGKSQTDKLNNNAIRLYTSPSEYNQFIITRASTNEQLKHIETYFKETFKSTRVRFAKVNHIHDKLVSFEFQTKMANETRFFTRFSVDNTENFNPFNLIPVTEHEILMEDVKGTQIKFTPEQSVSSFSTKESMTNQESMGENPVLVINGKIVSTNKETSYETNQGITTLLPSKAIALYGNKAKDGAIVIDDPNYTTKVNGKYLKTPKSNTTTTIIPSAFKVRITKNTTDQELETIKKDLKEKHNVDFNYTITRNKSNEITGITIKYKTANNNKGNYSVNGDSSIKDIYIFEDEDGRTGIGNAGSQEEIREQMEERKAILKERYEQMAQEHKERQEEMETIREEQEERRQELEEIVEKRSEIQQQKMKERQEALEEKRALLEEKREEIMEVRQNALEEKRALLEEKREEMNEVRKKALKEKRMAMEQKREEMHKRRESAIATGYNVSNQKLFITSSPNGATLSTNDRGGYITLIKSTMTNNAIKDIGDYFKKNNVKYSYSNLKRNAKGEITKISIQLKAANGNKTKASFGDGKKAIPTISLGFVEKK